MVTYSKPFKTSVFIISFSTLLFIKEKLKYLVTKHILVVEKDKLFGDISNNYPIV